MKLILGLLLIFAMVGCKNAKENDVDGTEISENAQQIGDMMASIDEGGGKNDGSLAFYQQGLKRSFQRVFPREEKTQVASLFFPEATAGSCTNNTSSGFGTCNTGTKSITRTFACTLHDSVTFSGNVTYTWGGGGAVGCSMTSSSDYVRRVPNITVTGRRGATLTITKTSTIGQSLVRGSSAGEFTFASDGINRRFTTSGGQILFNHTTQASGVLVHNAAARVGRTLSGGTIQVKNNLTNVTCTYAPSASNVITWETTACNCPTKGTWSGTCDDGNGHTSTTSLVINGCGTAQYTEGSDTSDVIFDRCGT